MDSGRILATVNRLLKANGEMVAYTPPAVPTGTDTPWYPPDNVEAQPYADVPFVSINAGMARYFKFTRKRDEDAPKGTLLAIMPGDVLFTPAERGKITRTDGDWLIAAFDALAPAGVPLLYFLELSR